MSAAGGAEDWAAGGAEDRAPLERALALAARGLFTTDPNPRVGCVIVRDGAIVGEGFHERAGGAHAEVAALRAAGAAAEGATAYVTLEPCSHTGRTPPCVDALIAARVARVVCSTIDPNPRVSGAGVRRLQAAGILVSVGELARESRALNPGFFSRFERARPWIRLKLAMSLDARTAPAHGGRLWITGGAARADVQNLRARSSAILTGAGTVRVDDPELNVRLRYGPWVRQPLRVVLDPMQSCPPTARIFAGGGALVFAAEGAPAAPEPRPLPAGVAVERVPISEVAVERVPASQVAVERVPASQVAAERVPVSEVAVERVPVSKVAVERVPVSGVAVERVPVSGRGLDLRAVIERLTAREVNELLVECGPRLAAAFVEARLVDELILYMAPFLLGADAAPLTALYELASKGPYPAFAFDSAVRIGEDLRIVLTPRGS